MKVSSLPPDTDLTTFRVKVPAKALKAFRAHLGGEPLMYPVGHVMGYGFMMSPDAPGASNRRLYPLPPEVSTTDILNWKLAD
jgi:hypothetical protein